jgi:hypothetical protein
VLTFHRYALDGGWSELKTLDGLLSACFHEAAIKAVFPTRQNLGLVSGNKFEVLSSRELLSISGLDCVGAFVSRSGRALGWVRRGFEIAAHFQLQVYLRMWPRTFGTLP